MGSVTGVGVVAAVAALYSVVGGLVMLLGAVRSAAVVGPGRVSSVHTVLRRGVWRFPVNWRT